MWRLEELWVWVKRKLCKHPTPWTHKEIRSADGVRVYWYATLECSKCEEVMKVEASFTGDPRMIAEALGVELGVER